ncbi:MAG: MBL fold metallo-hydrolase [Caldibacillus sp.]
MKWIQMPLGALQTNCYVLYHDEQALVIDPGDEGKKLINWLEKNALQPVAILLTHTHFDHIGAVDELREKYKIPLYVHKEEKDWLQNPVLNGSSLFFPDKPLRVEGPDRIIEGEGELTIGPFHLTILETPGHSPGSISFYDKGRGVIFAGDTLFFGSIGRTDLPGGDHERLIHSIRTKIFTLPKETTVLPGHGPGTTVGREINENPFFR